MDKSTTKQQKKSGKQQRRRAGKKAKAKTAVVVRKPQAKVVKNRGVDVRDQRLLPFANNLNPSGMTSVVSVVADLNKDAIAEFAIGYVLRLVEIGYATPNPQTSNQWSYPYYLVQEIINQFLLAARGEILTVGNLPRGLLHIFDAVRPKRCPYKTGYVSYRWTETSLSAYSIPWQYNVEYLVDMGILTVPIPDSYGYSVTTAPTAYTQELGSAAWDEMVAFLTQTSNSPLLQICRSTEQTDSFKDPSAFTMVYPQLGEYGRTRGYTTQLFNPVKIRSPIYSVFGVYSDETIISAESHISAGSPRWLATRMLTMKDEKLIHNKIRPTFLPVDFDDLFDSLSYIVGKAAELTSQSNVSPLVTATCPLSSPMVALLVRGILAALCNKNASSDNTLSGFVPFQYPMSAANVSTIAKTAVLPFMWVENVRSLSLLAVDNPNPKSQGQVFVFAPVLGTWNPGRTDWNFSYGNGTPLYGIDTANFDITTCNIGTANRVIAVTGDALADAIAIWNEWISQFTACLPVATFSTTQNNPALYSCLVHRGFNYNQQEVVGATTVATRSTSKDKKPVFKYSDLRKVVKAVSGNPTYTCERYIASNYPMGEAEYEVYSTWVLPRVLVDNDYDINRYTGNLVMPHIVRSIGNPMILQAAQPAYPLLTSKWEAYATMATHQPTASMSENCAVLWEASKKGEGGFLGSVLAEFAANLTGIPMLASLGNLIPF